MKLVLVSLILNIFFSFVTSSEYSIVTLQSTYNDNVLYSGTVSIVKSDHSLSIYYNITDSSFENGTIYTAMVLNHGNLNVLPKIEELFNPLENENCNAIGYLGQIKNQDIILNGNSSLNLTSTNSVVGLVFVIFKGILNCPSSFSSESFIPEFYGIIGIGNNGLKTIPKALEALIDPKEVSSSNKYLQEKTNYNAICSVKSTLKSTGITGTVFFSVVQDTMNIYAQIKGLQKDTIHGIHIHSFGDLSVNDGTSIGGHWKNSNQLHSLPNNITREYGDIGNICNYDNDNIAYYYYKTNYLPLYGNNNILGRSIAIHATRDNGTADSFGARTAWCVISQTQKSIPFTIPNYITFEESPICNNNDINIKQDSSNSTKEFIFYVVASFVALYVFNKYLKQGFLRRNQNRRNIY